MKVLALDLMGVIAVQPCSDLSRASSKEESVEWKRNAKKMDDKVCIGAISEQELLESLEISPDGMKRALDSVEPDPDAKALVKAAKEKGWTTCLLSTHTTRWANYLLDKFEIKLDYQVISDAIKARKPHKEIYLELLHVTGAKPEEVLFVDNRAHNLETARELGFNCILMQRDERECFEPSVKRLREVAGMLH